MEKEKGKMRTDGQVYVINGVKVPFPAKAYPTQITMMSKILRGLDKKQNCLLESPTGSGKTLALLCSCLAWQKNESEKAALSQKLAEKQRIRKLIAMLDEEDAAAAAAAAAATSQLAPGINERTWENHSTQKADRHQTIVRSMNETSTPSKQTGDDASKDLSDEVDFQYSRRRFRTPNGTLPNAKRQKKATSDKNGDDDGQFEEESKADPAKQPSWRIETKNAVEIMSINGDGKLQSEEKGAKVTDLHDADEDLCGKEKSRVPRIFFGTRTKKQITQIVRELRKTDFKSTRMTILSSRENSCIHPEVSKSKDKNEECRRHVKGLDGKICKFHGNAPLLATPAFMKRHKLCDSWDIEDLVKAGKKARACPYYAARKLMTDAEIIFCPYNYLVDPFIRSQMDINLKDEIVVLDEAHNIEDFAREAASISCTSSQLQDMIEELNKLVLVQVMIEEHRTVRDFCSIILNWLESLSDVLKPAGFETSIKILRGDEMAERLRFVDITSSTFDKYKEMLSKIVAAEYDAPENIDIDAPKLSTKWTTLLKQLTTALEKVLDKSCNFSDDFKIVISRKAGLVKRPSHSIDGWKSARNNTARKTWVFSLNFWCLNPAVIFSGIGESSRCVVLTSGTLSPMSSFSSELGVKFPIQLEANHVVPESQVWVGALTVGTNNNNIKANYQTSETFAFQDEVGKVVLKICQTVPRGVLCFFPSYSMLEKLRKRWQTTDIWSQLLDVKMVYAEPRGSDRLELDGVMKEFYEAANDSRVQSITGALLLAVCRGKVSEGLDFTDDNARAVITIGIPFPDFKDTQVELKRDYNNKYSRTRGLLTGTEWYEIQAYRALNQALGRCIRHRKDWGAILLLDERFGRAKYREGLSKWVRGRCKTYTDFDECLSSLKSFSEARKRDPFPESSEISSRVKHSTESRASENDKSRQLREFYQNVDSKENLSIAAEDFQKAAKNMEAASFNLNVISPLGKQPISPRQLETNLSQLSKTVERDERFEDTTKTVAEDTGDSRLPTLNGNLHDVHNTNSDMTRSGSIGSVLKPKGFRINGRTLNEIGSTLCNRSKLFKSSQPSLPHLSNAKDVARQECASEQNELSRQGESSDQIKLSHQRSGVAKGVIDISDDEIGCSASSNIVTSDGGFSDCANNLEPNIVGFKSATSLSCKEETPVLFSDHGTEVGSFEDRFWQCTDAEMCDVLSETVPIPEEMKPDISPYHDLESVKDKLKKEEVEIIDDQIKEVEVIDNQYDTCTKQMRKTGQKHFKPNGNVSMVEKNDAESELKEAMFSKAEESEAVSDARNYADFHDVDLMLDKNAIVESSVINDQPSINRKRSVAKKKSNIRMAARNDLGDPADFAFDDSETQGVDNQGTFKCLHCRSRIIKQGSFSRKRIKSETISKLISSRGKEVDVIETNASAVRNCKPVESSCECGDALNGIKMNAIFSEKDFAVYVPLFCTKCHSKKRKRRLVGLRTARIGTPKSQSKIDVDEGYSIYIFPDEVAIENMPR